MFDATTIKAVTSVAVEFGYDPAALLAVVQVESGGVAFAMVAGRAEPLIRFEGHYFDKRLFGAERMIARGQGLASPKAGAVANPKSQAARWKMLERAFAIDAQAAYESVSFGVGQVMGAHWEWLKFGSVTELVNLCRRDVAGQVELMVRFIDRAGLGGAVRSRDWATFARGYNGPAYRKNRYDTQLANAYARNVGRVTVPPVADPSMTEIQRLLVANGFKVAIDGVRGKQTTDAIVAFQKSRKLKPDGIVGSATWRALNA